MPIPKSQLTLLAFALLVVIGGSFYWFNIRENSDTGARNLAAQGIDVSPDNFLAQITAGNSANIHYFLLAGGDPGTANAGGTTALMAAAQTGNPAIVSQLIAALPKNPQAAMTIINQQETETGKTALIFGVEKGNTDVVGLLLGRGADTAISDKLSDTPLMAAVKSKQPALIAPLISADAQQHNGSTLGEANNSGDTALTLAIRAQNKDMVDSLIAAKADAVSADRSGVTPLMVAAEAGDAAIGDKLLTAGAKTDMADRFGNTPLSIAISHSHPAFAQSLLSIGADPDFHANGGPVPLQAAVSMQPFDGALFTYLLAHSKQTPELDAALLFDAIDHKNPELAKALLDHGNGINAKALNANGETLLYHAIENNLEDTAIMLLEKGADVYQTGVAGITPLERATKHNEIKIVQKLLALGAPADQKTSEGYTVAEMAVYNGYPEILDALLAKNAKLEKDFGILWAIRDGHGKAVPILLKYGAHPNVMSNSGDPALWLAASAGETEAVSALIQSHVAIDFPNTAQGMTPLAVASHGGQLAVVKLLVDAGAKLETPDANGMTALAQAAYMAKPDVVAYLISKGANVNASDKRGRGIADIAALGEASGDRDKVLALLHKK